MKIIKIEAFDNGAHDHLISSANVFLPTGWAVVPEGLPTQNFPFGSFDVDIADGVPTIKNWVAGVVPEPPAPTSKEVKAERSTAIKAACAEAITGGFDADVLGRGLLHYTLTEIQQRDLQTQYAAIKAGATSALWHDSSRVTHEIYTAVQFTALFQVGYSYIISCKIRSDWLEQLAHDLADSGDLTGAAAVDWSTVLPESYQTQCDAQIAEMLEGGGNA